MSTVSLLMWLENGKRTEAQAVKSGRDTKPERLESLFRGGSTSSVMPSNTLTLPDRTLYESSCKPEGKGAAMSIASFVADPSGYSKGHVIQFQHQSFPPAQAGMQVAAALNHWGGAWKGEEYQMIPGQFTRFRFHESGLQYFKQGQAITMPDRVGTGSKAMHTVDVDHGAIDLGIRYLPWNADTVTYMAFDGAATTFFTGPINGCSVYTARQGNGTLWAFHSNRNNHGTHNAGLKAAMTNAVCARLALPGLQILHQAVYQQEYHAMGFVCGQIKHGQWVFYVVDTRMKANAGHFATTVTRLP